MISGYFLRTFRSLAPWTNQLRARVRRVNLEKI